VEVLHVDRVMPEFDVNVVQHVVVNAGAAETYDALLRADLMDNPLTRLLVRARDVPNLLRLRGAAPARERPRLTLRDAGGEEAGWVTLHDEPGVEFLVGLLGQFWRRDYGIVRGLTAEEFVRFDRPGYAKTVVDFSLRPYGSGRTLLTYENRTATTDAAARRRFLAYWRLLRPFVQQMERAALVAAKREAEGDRAAHPASSFGPLTTG
jgi:hypothetical protein